MKPAEPADAEDAEMKDDAAPPSEDDALRAKLMHLSQKIPAPMRQFALPMVQGMDPAALHNLLVQALAHMEQTSPSAEHETDHQDALNVLTTLRSMEPSAVHTLALEILRSGV